MESVKNLITVDQLDAFPEDDGNRYELIEGELFVSRAPGIPHQRVLSNLLFFLLEYLRRNPVGIVVPGAGAIFSKYDAVIPDLALVKNERWDQVVADDRFVAGPDLVIEILSPGKTNRHRDLIAKQKLYEKFHVGEYWIVDPENRSVVISRHENESFGPTQVIRDNEVLTSPLLPEFSLPVAKIFTL
jgi:Uma2 family endonuclease